MELLNENICIDTPAVVPLEMESEEVDSIFKNTLPKDRHPKSDNVAIIIFNDEKDGGTKGTEGTLSNNSGCIGSLDENSEGTQGTFNLDAVVNPLHDADKKQIEKLSFSQLNLPCFIVRDDWFELDGAALSRCFLHIARKPF
jgi:hypothetical protein